MSGILAEFVEKIISLKEPTIIEVAGQQYANQEFARIKPHVDRPSVYEVTGLDSIVQLLRKEIERVGGFAFVRVASYDRVCVSTSYRADMSRDTLYTATADVPGFRGGWRDQEQAVIELRSLFIPGEGTRYLLDLLSRMSKTMYCACLQETSHVRTCGVERTYQRYRALSPLSLDAARAAELGVSYGQYKARGVV